MTSNFLKPLTTACIATSRKLLTSLYSTAVLATNVLATRVLSASVLATAVLATTVLATAAFSNTALADIEANENDALLQASGKHGKVVRACTTDASMPPHTDLPGTGRPGLLFQIVSDAIKAAGRHPEYVRLPWLRCIHEMRQGNVDAIFPLTSTPQRQTEFAFPQTDNTYLFEMNYRVFLQRGGPFDQPETLIPLTNEGKGWDFEYYRQIKKLGLSAPLGFVTYEQLKGLDLAESPYELVQGLTLVSRGRLDGYITEQISGWLTAKDHGVNKQLMTSGSVRTDREHLAFNLDYYQKNQAFVDKLWQQLAPQRSKALQKYYKTLRQ